MAMIILSFGNEIGDDDSEMMKVLGLLEKNAFITAKQMSEQMDISTRKRYWKITQ